MLVTVGALAPLALKRATSRIPMVLTSGDEPVGGGVVESLASQAAMSLGRLMVPDLGGKRLAMLQEAGFRDDLEFRRPYPTSC